MFIVIDFGVNIDYVVMLCNVCGMCYFDLICVVFVVEEVGVDVIMLYLCEDCCYIVDVDVCQLCLLLKMCMNFECVVMVEMFDIVCEVCLYDVCFVLEKCEELMIEGGFDVVGYFEVVCVVCKQFVDEGVCVLLFIDLDDMQICVVYEVGVLVIELYMGCYVEVYDEVEQQCEYECIVVGVQVGVQFGLKVNVGYGLYYMNVQQIVVIDGIVELNIGYVIVVYVIFVGWDNVVCEMKVIMVVVCVVVLYGGVC